MRINIELSQKSIQSAIKQIENCRDKLIRKNREFVKRLGEVGIPEKCICSFYAERRCENKK